MTKYTPMFLSNKNSTENNRVSFSRLTLRGDQILMNKMCMKGTLVFGFLFHFL